MIENSNFFQNCIQILTKVIFKDSEVEIQNFNSMNITRYGLNSEGITSFNLTIQKKLPLN